VSIAHIKGFDKENVSQFFDILEKLADENQIDALCICNVNESGFTTVQKKSPKVVTLRGKHQVGTISSAEQGVCCTSAAGHFLPPMIIFKRQRMNPALMIGNLFVKWLKHFIEHVKTTTEKKALLVLDGHSTYSKNLEAIKIARENGVLLLQLPGHTTHCLQPLDVAIFKPFQTFYDAAVSKWLQSNPGENMMQFVVTALLAEAYSKAATLSNAADGFKTTGIWPVDRAVFSGYDFVASENLNCVQTPQEILNEPVKDLQQKCDTQEVEKEEKGDGENQFTEENPQGMADSPKTNINVPVNVNEISPKPQPNSKQAARLTKGAQKVEILTSSPYKRKLEEVQEKKKKATEERKTTAGI
jgi:hypothetical protein